VAARHRDHDVGPQHYDHQQRHEKRGGHGQKVAPNEASPAALPRRQRLLIKQVFVPGDQPFSVERGPGPIRCCSAIRPSSMRIRRLAPISAISSRPSSFPSCRDLILPCRLAFFCRVQAIAGWVLTHSRRGPAHRRQHRQAAGDAEQATNLYRPTSAMTSTPDISLHTIGDIKSGDRRGTRLARPR
jgi:hypothetical protein